MEMTRSMSTIPEPIPSEAIPLEILIELGQATTAYHEATPDRLAQARLQYEAALRRFQNWRPDSQS